MKNTLSIMGQNNISNLCLSETQFIYFLEDEYNKGYKHFLIVTLSNFDCFVFNATLILNKIYPDIQISVLVNDYQTYLIKTANPWKKYNINYIYYPLQTISLNDKLILQCKYMIEHSDKLFCYFDGNNKSFEKLIIDTKTNGKETYNLYDILNVKK